MPPTQTILQNLISYPILGGQSNLEIIEYIKRYLTDLGVEYHLAYNDEKTKVALHCRIGPAVDGGVILSAHTDVVPVEGQKWDTNPFELVEKEGKLYARGSADMKGFLACCLAVVPEMLVADLQKPIYLAFSFDEEVGCLGGPMLVEAIKNTYAEKPKYAIIGEPTLLQPVVGQKGIAVFQTTVNGSAGHSSRIKQEVSAIHEAARLILWLENKMEELIAVGHIDNRFEPNHSSIHIGMVEGGVAHNIVADKCSFCWDLRTIPQDKVEDILADFEAFCSEREQILQQRFADFGITTEAHHPPVPPLDTPEHLSVVGLIRELTGVEELQTVAFAAEAGQFSEGGFEAVICGPGSIAQAHRANEFISCEQLEKGTEFIRRLVGMMGLGSD
ncbi:MAG: acetylornithine deacetylase [Chitinophagales bacterium]